MAEQELGGQALLIGINSYPGIPGRNLEGCVNDVQIMQTLLCERFGFREQDIKQLVDSQATRANILDELRGLEERSGRDEPIVFCFSGHGSRVPARSSAVVSGWHETLVPYDSSYGIATNTDILDEELKGWLQRLTAKSRNVTLLFDCCHSGTLHRSLAGGMPRGFVREVSPSRSIPRAPSASVGGLASRLGLPDSDSYVVFSACRDDETAREHVVRAGVKRRVYGALTYFLSQQVQAVNRPLSWQELYERVYAEVSSVYPSQHPVCEGARTQLLFNRTAEPPARYILVSASTDTSVELSGGQLQQVVLGSQWELISPDQGTSDPPQQSLGTVEVTDAAANSATGRRLRPGLPLPRYCQAREISRPIATQWPIRLAPLPQPLADQPEQRALHAKLEQALRSNPLLNVTDSGHSSDATVHIVPGSSQPGQTEGIPTLGALPQAAIAVTGPGNDLLMDLVPASPQHVEATAKRLGQLARRHMLRSLANPGSQLANAVDLQILRKTPSGWQTASQTQSGFLRFVEGEQIALQLTNRVGRRLFIHLLWLDSDGSISPLYPPPGGLGELRPDSPVSFGNRPGDALTLGFPRPVAPDTSLAWCLRPPSSEVIDHLKLLVTPQPIDVHALLQPSLAQTRALGSPMQRGLVDLLRGGTTYRSLPTHRGAADDWYAATWSLCLQHREP